MMDDMAEIGAANHRVYEKKQKKNRKEIPKGECLYFDEAYVSFGKGFIKT